MIKTRKAATPQKPAPITVRDLLKGTFMNRAEYEKYVAEGIDLTGLGIVVYDKLSVGAPRTVGETS